MKHPSTVRADPPPLRLATQDVARARAARIRAGIQAYLTTLADVAAAYAQRDWTALGYESWEAYVDGEYGAERLKLTPEHRQKAVAELRLAGMSQRAIGTALGVSQETVRRDLSGDANVSPAEIQGADGKSYAATRPSSPTGTGATAPSAATQPDQSGPGEVESASESWRDSTSSSDHPRPTGEEPTPGLAASATVAQASEAPTGVAAPAGAGDSFAEVLDRLVPDDNPHREWQSNFLKALGGVNRLMLFAVGDVAEKADEQCVEELARVADRLATWRAEVMQARKAAIPYNVTPIRRIS